MASAVCRVCRGGGVVASLMYGVSLKYGVSVEYGGSEEYDASLKLDVVCLEFDVVVVCTKRTKDKEKHYLKISAR